MENLSRRAVLTGACAILTMGFVNIPSAANASVKRLSDGRLSVRIKSIPELASVGGAVQIGKLKGTPVGLARTGDTKYVAFSLACPHQGVKVVKSENGWVCPAHQSEFESDGDLLLGPATSRLTRIPVRLRSGNAVIG